MEAQKQMEGIWTLVTPDGKRYHGYDPLECCRSEHTDRVMAAGTKKGQLEIFDALEKRYEKKVVDVWKKPKGECPDGNLIVEIDLKNGDSDIAIVFIDDDGETLHHADDNEDVYTAWCWSDVSRYAVLDDLLAVR